MENKSFIFYYKFIISRNFREKFKILRNTSITFKDRLYQDFGLDIKKVRLREKK